MPNISIDVQLIQSLTNIAGSIEAMKGLQQSTNATLATMVEQLINLRNELNEYEIEAAASRAFRIETEIKQLESVDKQYELDIHKLQEAQKQSQEMAEKIKTSGAGGNTSERMRAMVKEYMEKHQSPVDLKGFRFSEAAWRNLLIAAVCIVLLWVLIDPASLSGLLLRLVEWLRGA